jgi:hypothetical protein
MKMFSTIKVGYSSGIYGCLDRETQDRRVKLSKGLHEKIKKLYRYEIPSQRELARMFGVSRSLIRYIVMPEKLERAKVLFAERQMDGRYYDRVKHNK